jgi:hypothetical protein
VPGFLKDLWLCQRFGGCRLLRGVGPMRSVTYTLGNVDNAGAFKETVNNIAGDGAVGAFPFSRLDGQ